MNFKLSYNFFLILKSLIWSVFVIYFFYFFDNITKNRDILYSVLLSAIILQMTVISFVNNWYRCRPTLLDWFRLMTFLVIVLNFLTLIITLNNQDNFNGFILQPSFMLESILAILIGLLGLKFGEIIYLILNKDKRFTSKKLVKKYDFRNPFFFYLFSITVGIIQIILMFKGEVGYGTFQENTTSDFSFLFQIIFIISSCILSVLAIFKYLFSNKSNYLKYIFYVFFLTQVVYGFLSGMKQSIIVPIIVILIPYLLSGRILPKTYMIAGFFSLLVIYPLNDNYRAILNKTSNITKNQAFGIAAIETFKLDFAENVSEGTDSFSGRLSLFPYLVYAVEKENEWNYYKNLDRYIYLPIAWILPRALLPDKPKSETGAILNNKIYGYSTNSLTPTTYGWSYLEGGSHYVFIIFLLFGFFITYFQEKLHFNNLFSILLYSNILIILLKVESDVYFLMTSILQSILVYYIFYKLFIKEINIKKIN